MTVKNMKTIDEIVARSDYKNLNEALNERVKEIAEIIRKKMYYLQIEELDDYRIKITCKKCQKVITAKEKINAR